MLGDCRAELCQRCDAVDARAATTVAPSARVERDDDARRDRVAELDRGRRRARPAPRAAVHGVASARRIGGQRRPAESAAASTAAAATTATRSHRVAASAPPFLGPLDERAVDLVRVGRRERAPRAARTTRALPISRSRCARRARPAGAAASRRERRTSETAPVAGSAIGKRGAARRRGSSAPRPDPGSRPARRPSRGRLPPATRHRPAATRKSEKTKTKLPPGSSARCSPRNGEGALERVLRRGRRVGEPRRRASSLAVAARRRRPVRGAAGEVERGELGARGDGARDDRADGFAHHRRLRQPRQGRRVERSSPGAGRARARRAARRRRAARGRRTRRGPSRRTGAPSRPSRSSRPGRRVGTAASRSPRCPGPRRCERRLPNGRPVSACRGTSGNVSRPRPATGVSCPSRARAAVRARGSVP